MISIFLKKLNLLKCVVNRKFEKKTLKQINFLHFVIVNKHFQEAFPRVFIKKIGVFISFQMVILFMFSIFKTSNAVFFYVFFRKNVFSRSASLYALFATALALLFSCRPTWEKSLDMYSFVLIQFLIDILVRFQLTFSILHQKLNRFCLWLFHRKIVVWKKSGKKVWTYRYKLIGVILREAAILVYAHFRKFFVLKVQWKPILPYGP